MRIVLSLVVFVGLSILLLRGGEEIAQLVATRLAREVRENHFEVAAELPEDLAAGAAGRRRSLGIGHDRHAPELAMSFGQRLEHRHALGADRQPVGGVLDVAAGDHGAVGGFQRGADLELRIARAGKLAGLARGRDQIRVAQ